MTHLVFSLGPVQGFIAQSRRTADGWASSYLLSYLMGYALHSVQSGPHKGTFEVVEPSVGPHLAMWQALVTGVPHEDAVVAALPNTILLALGDDVAPATIGEALRDAIRDGWDGKDGVATNVRSLLAALVPDLPEEQWVSQLAAQWETYWAWGPTSREAFSALAARKAVRDLSVVQEVGERCTVCGERMALWVQKADGRSPYDQTRSCWSSGTGNRGWGAAINNAAWTPTTLVRDDGSERLCAPCLVKRMLPWADTPMRLWPVNANEPAAFPSTSTIATVRYRQALLDASLTHAGLRDALRGLLDEAAKTRLGSSHRTLAAHLVRPADFQCWSANAEGFAQLQPLLKVDGDLLLFGDGVANEHSLSLERRESLGRAYRNVRNNAQDAGVGAPPIYWAMVAMDGDNMGRFLRHVSALAIDTREVSALLAEFAQSVPAMVRAGNGRLVFAGGDDVLGMFSVVDALATADVLRRDFAARVTAWASSHPALAGQNLPTLSAGIVYAHHQAPLGRVIQAAHTLLKTWAKEGADRNAFALQRFQRGGPAETFARRWDDSDGTSNVERINTILEGLQGNTMGDRLFYQLRELGWFLGAKADVHGFSEVDREAMLAAMVRKSRLGGDDSTSKLEASRATAALIRRLCEGAVVPSMLPGQLPAEPLIVARFLAGEGRA